MCPLIRLLFQKDHCRIDHRISLGQSRREQSRCPCSKMEKKRQEPEIVAIVKKEKGTVKKETGMKRI